LVASALFSCKKISNNCDVAIFVIATSRSPFASNSTGPDHSLDYSTGTRELMHPQQGRLCPAPTALGLVKCLGLPAGSREQFSSAARIAFLWCCR
jgi:hypothetical protein